MNIQKGDKIRYANSDFEVAEVKDFPHGKMIGIYDEPPSKHIDYLNPDSVSVYLPCNGCQGGGCPTCSGYGEILY